MRKLIIIMLLAFSGCATLNVDVPLLAGKHVVLLYGSTALGTGFYVEYKHRTYLVTNKHVCGDNDAMFNGKAIVEVVVTAEAHDLCILESDRDSGLDIALGDLDMLQKIYVTGHPLGGPFTVAEGLYMGNAQLMLPWIIEYPLDTMVTTAKVLSGNSGSPLLNIYGKVVGVVFGNNSEKMGFAVPREILIEFLEKHRR